MLRRSNGFTLMEVIGVLAVIAIIAAVATPQIFQAIQDAEVTSLVQQANDLKGAVARYYKDTGTWPHHLPSSANDHQKQFMKNANPAGNPIGGWDGPYLEAELENPITPGGRIEVLVTDNVNFACDLDGDGNGDGKFAVLRVDAVDNATALNISSMLDKDGDQTSGDGDWKKAGRVKRYGGTHASVLIMCLARV